MQAQLGFWQDYLTLWQNTARRMMGEEVQPVIAEDPRDRRFKDEAWRENEVFDFIRQSYLLSARFFQNVVDATSTAWTRRRRRRWTSTRANSSMR